MFKREDNTIAYIVLFESPSALNNPYIAFENIINIDTKYY